jgi:hypothetical protein
LRLSSIVVCSGPRSSIDSTSSASNNPSGGDATAVQLQSKNANCDHATGFISGMRR